MAEVIWAEPALHALEEIADYIALDNPEADKKLVKAVFQKVELLEGNSKVGNVPPELKNTRYRRVVVSPVYLYYRMEGSKVLLVFVDRVEREFNLLRFSEN